MGTPVNSLPPGTQVDHYIIEETLSRGGFSVVYLANVTGLNKKVAIKEFMPGKVARRNKDMSVVPISEEFEDSFINGRKLFFTEASTLAKIKHPNIVNVFNFFSANGTIYMVMEYHHGENLQAYIRKHEGKLSEKFILTVFPPLLGGLKAIHKVRLLHLDIKPSNIHLRPGGVPLLLDFGSVHQMMKTRRFQTSQVLTPGYSPIEQYDSSGYVGPWSDIYAIGATIRACMEGKTPPASKDRNKEDTMELAAEVFKKDYSEKLLAAVDWAMELDPLHRPQNVDDLLKAFPQKNR